MRKIGVHSAFVTIAIFLSAHAASADVIASCSGDTSGKAYYAYNGIVPKEKSGFSDDTTSDTKISLLLNSEREWDVLWVDGRKEIYSARDEGGTVSFIGIGSSGFSVAVTYDTDAGLVTSIYSISSNPNDEWQLALLQSKQTELITKFGFEIVDCQMVDLDSMARLFGIQ